MAMHTFKVVKEPYGWAVRLNSGMVTPFWSWALAVQEANCLCDALRSHGVRAEVVIEGVDSSEAAKTASRFGAARLAVRLRSRRPGLR